MVDRIYCFSGRDSWATNKSFVNMYNQKKSRMNDQSLWTAAPEKFKIPGCSQTWSPVIEESSPQEEQFASLQRVYSVVISPVLPYGYLFR